MPSAYLEAPPEAAYSVSQVVGAERPLPHPCSEGPRCMYSCMRSICMCLCRTVPHVNGCLLCACPCTSPVSSVLPRFLNDIGKKTIEAKKAKKAFQSKAKTRGSDSLRSSLARRFRRSRSLPDRARKTAPSSGSSQPKSSCEAGLLRAWFTRARVTRLHALCLPFRVGSFAFGSSQMRDRKNVALTKETMYAVPGQTKNSFAMFFLAWFALIRGPTQFDMRASILGI